MISNWALPQTVTQYAEENAENLHISWQEVDNFSSLKILDGKSIKTSDDLLHISRDPKRDIVQKTYYLKLTNFNFQNMPSQLSGIEVKLDMNRGGRITDETIQLCFSDNLVGDNKADRDLHPKKIYGGENDTWNSQLTLANIQNSSFGVILRFQSHPNFPHKCRPFIDAVQIRIY